MRLFGFQERSLSKFWSKGKVHEPSSSGFFVGSVACGKKTRAASQGSTSFSTSRPGLGEIKAARAIL